MKRFLGIVLLLAIVALSVDAFAGPSWPDKGWHKGPYLTANVGMMQVGNDKHAVTRRPFNGAIDPAFGITFGWDIADWIGPMLQITYATATGQVGDPANNAAQVAYLGGTFVALVGTFPTQNARQHVLDLGLFCRATLPYFINAGWQKQNFKFIPYVKLGGVGHALITYPQNKNNTIGAYGGGIGIGAGVEMFIWKGIYVGIDATENIIFQGKYKRNIQDATGVTQNLTLTDGGTTFHFNLLGMFGYHF